MNQRPSKHFEFCQKYSAALAFSTLFSMLGYPDEVLSIVFEILLLKVVNYSSSLNKANNDHDLKQHKCSTILLLYFLLSLSFETKNIKTLKTVLDQISKHLEVRQTLLKLIRNVVKHSLSSFVFDTLHRIFSVTLSPRGPWLPSGPVIPLSPFTQRTQDGSLVFCSGFREQSGLHTYIYFLIRQLWIWQP